MTDCMVGFFALDRPVTEHGGRAVEDAGPVWKTIVASADRYDAETVALGSRGLAGVRSMSAQGVSNAAVRRPTLVIRRPAAAA